MFGRFWEGRLLRVDLGSEKQKPTRNLLKLQFRPLYPQHGAFPISPADTQEFFVYQASSIPLGKKKASLIMSALVLLLLFFPSKSVHNSLCATCQTIVLSLQCSFIVTCFCSSSEHERKPRNIHQNPKEQHECNLDNTNEVELSDTCAQIVFFMPVPRRFMNRALPGKVSDEMEQAMRQAISNTNQLFTPHWKTTHNMVMLETKQANTSFRVISGCTRVTKLFISSGSVHEEQLQRERRDSKEISVL